MNNYNYSNKTGGAIMAVASFSLAMATTTINFGIVANIQDEPVEKSQTLNNFMLFKNDRPTVQTLAIGEFFQKDQSSLKTNLLKWANSEMDNFLSNLHDELLLEYSDDLMSLATEIVMNNPQALKGF